MPSLPPAQPLGTPPPLLGPAVRITSGPYNGLKGNLAKQCLPGGLALDPQPSGFRFQVSEGALGAFCSVVIEFEHAWFEIVTERRWLQPLASDLAPGF